MCKKISIGFVVNNLVVGGVSAVLIKLCNALPKNNYDIHLINLSNNFEMESVIPLDYNIKKHVFNYTFLTSFSLPSYLKAAYYPKLTKARATDVLATINQLKLDILHFHTLPRQLVIGHLAKKQNPNLKLVFTDHSVRLTKGEYKPYQQFLLKLALKKYYNDYQLIAVSKAVNEYIKHNSLCNKKLNLLENSINLKDYNRSKPIISLSENKFIYISRMNHQKGHETLILAWKKIQRVDKGKLLLVGPDEANQKFQNMAKEDPSILFTGSVAEVKKYLDQSSVAVFPSQKEGLPISLLEMMAYELPIICSDINELTSVITNQQEGLHFKLDDIEDLKEKLVFALDEKEKMIKMGKNARAKVEQICLKNDPIPFHQNFYQSIM